MRQKAFSLKRQYALMALMQELPDLITRCPRCGGKRELWCREQETLCLSCGHSGFERETTSY